MNKQARIRIAPELLVDALGFPEGTVLINCVMESGIFTQKEVIWVVEHDDLAHDDDEPIDILPSFEINYTRKPNTWLTINWNKDDS